MPIYVYEGKLLNGSLVKGKLDAVNKEAANLLIREREIFPISIVEEGSGSSLEINFKKKIPYKDLAVFSRQMHFALAAGIPMLRTLDMVKYQIENVKLKNITSNVYEEVQKGKTLSEVLNKHNDIPYMFTAMVEVGEATGSLDNILKKTSEYYEIEADFAIKKLTSLIEPVMIVVLAFIVGFVVISLALPMFQIMGAV